MTTKTKTVDPIDRAVQVLNEALEADRACIDRMFRTEFPCNETLGDHRSIQVGPSFWPDRDHQVVRMLGIINGIFGVDENNRGPIAMQVNGSDEDPSGVVSFSRTADWTAAE